MRLARRLEASHVLDYNQLSEKLNISKLVVPAAAVGKTVMEVNFRGKFGVNIIAIENSKTLHESVRPDYVFESGDILFVSGTRDGLNKLSSWE